MKIAIQGHPFRGKEVIQILEILGGKNIDKLTGTYESFYYVDNKNEIVDDHKQNFLPNYKLYTLEEFEKEFPFKVGDLCIYFSDILGKDIVVRILGMAILDNCIMYEVGHKDITDKHSCIYKKVDILKPYKEMKEERNITLTLDKAKEWYKKGGELKEIALQAFTEMELNPLPRSWDEYCKQGNLIISWKYTIPIKYEALFKLEHLRNCWRQGDVPQGTNYKIRKVRNKYTVVYGEEDAFLSFCNKKMAEEFLKCFRDLIEKAGDLI